MIVVYNEAGFTKREDVDSFEAGMQALKEYKKKRYIPMGVLDEECRTVYVENHPKYGDYQYIKHIKMICNLPVKVKLKVEHINLDEDKGVFV